MHGTSECLRLMVAIGRFWHTRQNIFRCIRTQIRKCTHSIAAIFQTAPTSALLPRLEHTWHSHTSIPGCVLSGRQSACCTAHNSYHPIHPLPPPYLSRHPDALAPDSKLSCSAPCNPPRRRLLLFPFFQFGWGAGSERATHSPTPFYFLAAFTPTLRTVSITLLLAPPPQVAGRRKNIYIYLFLRGLRLPLPPSRSYPFSPFSPQLYSSLPPWKFSLSLVLDIFFLFLLFLSPSYFHLPLLTAPRRRASDGERAGRGG